jgi:hypothetical protein
MPFIAATSSRRRLVMVALLLLASAGGVIRYLAPQPSALHDLGTLLLVAWLPAVGNLVGYLARKIPWRRPPARVFAPDAAFTPQLAAWLEAVDRSSEPPIHAPAPDCIVVVGPNAFTARLSQPVCELLAAPGPQRLTLEFLRPSLALASLTPGTRFHLCLGTQAVATGQVETT